MNLRKKIGAAHAAFLLITGLATAAQPRHYSYMDTDWYKTHGVFAKHQEKEQAAQEKQRAEQEKQKAERKRLLDAKTIGLYVRNTTEYPCQTRLKIFARDSNYPVRTLEKSIPAGATVEILDDALDKNYVYVLTAFVGDEPFRMLGGGVMRIGRRITLDRNAKPVPVAKTPNLSTNKDWSIKHPTNKKVELVLELIQKQGAQPELRLRDQ